MPKRYSSAEICPKNSRTPDSTQPACFPETTADIAWALKHGAGGGAGGSQTLSSHRGSHREKRTVVYHNVSGRVLEATGLKGDFGKGLTWGPHVISR